MPGRKCWNDNVHPQIGTYRKSNNHRTNGIDIKMSVRCSVNFLHIDFLVAPTAIEIAPSPNEGARDGRADAEPASRSFLSFFAVQAILHDAVSPAFVRFNIQLSEFSRIVIP